MFLNGIQREGIEATSFCGPRRSAKDTANSPTRLHFFVSMGMVEKCGRWHAQTLLFVLLVHSPYKFFPKCIKEFCTVHFSVSQL